MDQETISLAVKSRKETITFHLQMLTIAQDNVFSERMIQIADKKGKANDDAKFKACVDSLAAWSVKNPELTNGTKDENGDPVTAALEGETPAEAVKAYFAEPTAAKEWIATVAVSSFRNSLFPSVTFVEPSE